MKKLGIWQVQQASLTRVAEASVELERHLEDWIASDPSLLREGLVIVGRQVQLEAGILDLLALDPLGRWVVIEIKRGDVDRKTVAQVVDYAACLAELSADALRAKLSPFLTANSLDLDELLEVREASDALDPEQRQLLLFVVGTGKADGLERVIRFLSGRHGMPFSVVLFDVFALEKDRMLLAREVSEQEMSEVVASPQSSVTVEAVLALAQKYGTQDMLRRTIEFANKTGLRIRPYKTSLMITPSSNGTRMLFTVWAKPVKDGLKVYVGVEPFAEFFPVERAEVERLIGHEGLRTLDQAEFDKLLCGLEALNLGSQQASKIE